MQCEPCSLLPLSLLPAATTNPSFSLSLCCCSSASAYHSLIFIFTSAFHSFCFNSGKQRGGKLPLLLVFPQPSHVFPPALLSLSSAVLWLQRVAPFVLGRLGAVVPRTCPGHPQVGVSQQCPVLGVHRERWLAAAL